MYAAMHPNAMPPSTMTTFATATAVLVPPSPAVATRNPATTIAAVGIASASRTPTRVKSAIATSIVPPTR